MLEIKSRSFRELQIGIIYLVLGFIGTMLTYLVPNVFAVIPPCLFKAFVGIPCPACGATHAGFYFAHFRFYDAFMSNPFFFLLFTGVLFWAFNSLLGLIFKRNFHVVLNSSQRKIVRLFFLAALPINWLFLIIQFLLGIKPVV